MPRSRSKRACGKDQTHYDRSFCGDVSLLRKGNDYGFDLPATAPPGATGGTPHGRSFDAEDVAAGHHASESRRGDVFQSASFSRDPAGGNEIRRFCASNRGARAGHGPGKIEIPSNNTRHTVSPSIRLGFVI